MNKVRCPNGHAYDSDLYRSCPICAQLNQAGRREGSGGRAAFSSGTGGDETMALGRSGASFSQGGGAGSWFSEGSGGSIPAGRYPEGSGDETVRFYPGDQNPGNAERKGPPVSGPRYGHFFPGGDETEALFSRAEDDGRTISLLNLGGSGTEVFRKAERNAPACGFLVCTEGPEYGRSFVLYPGRNFIGRSEEMDIRLSDRSVSRNRHAVIIYEPKGRKFYAQRGESHELFYVNDSVVLSDIELNDFDELLIGSTTFRFVPFCGKRFGWEEKGD